MNTCNYLKKCYDVTHAFKCSKIFNKQKCKTISLLQLELAINHLDQILLCEPMPISEIALLVADCFSWWTNNLPKPANVQQHLFCLVCTV